MFRNKTFGKPVVPVRKVYEFSPPLTIRLEPCDGLQLWSKLAVVLSTRQVILHVVPAYAFAPGEVDGVADDIGGTLLALGAFRRSWPIPPEVALRLRRLARA